MLPIPNSNNKLPPLETMNFSSSSDFFASPNEALNDKNSNRYQISKLSSIQDISQMRYNILRDVEFLDKELSMLE